MSCYEPASGASGRGPGGAPSGQFCPRFRPFSGPDSGQIPGLFPAQFPATECSSPRGMGRGIGWVLHSSPYSPPRYAMNGIGLPSMVGRGGGYNAAPYVLRGGRRERPGRESSCSPPLARGGRPVPAYCGRGRGDSGKRSARTNRPATGVAPPAKFGPDSCLFPGQFPGQIPPTNIGTCRYILVDG